MRMSGYSNFVLMAIDELTDDVQSSRVVTQPRRAYLHEALLIPALLYLIQVALRHPPLKHYEEEAVDEQDDREYNPNETSKIKRSGGATFMTKLGYWDQTTHRCNLVQKSYGGV